MLVGGAACRGQVATFADQSQGRDADVIAWQWDFGNGQFATGRDPQLTFSSLGSYSVSLTVTDAHGCQDSTRQTVRITAPRAAFEVLNTAPCVPGDLFFMDLSQSDTALVNWWWDFGDGSRDSFIVNPTHRYLETGAYQVQLTVEDANGCLDSVTQEVRAYEYPIPRQEFLIRATVDEASRDAWLEWDRFQNAEGELVQIERSEDHGLNYLMIHTRPYHPDSTRFIDRFANVNLRPYVYRLALIDSCGNRMPWSHPAKTIFLKAEPAGEGVTLTWTAYKRWANGVKYYTVERREAGGFVSLESVEDTTFLDNRPPTSGTQPIQYRIRAYERFGNDTSSLSNTVTYTPDPEIFVPSAFSPNNDEINDRFMVNGGVLPLWAARYEIKIFSRIGGEEVFASESIDQSWDGRNRRGWAVPEGVYVYVIQLTSMDGYSRQVSGTITLYR